MRLVVPQAGLQAAVLPATAQGQGDLRLAEFAVGHPRAADLQRTLTEIGTPVDTYTAAATEFRVQLHTPRGTVAITCITRKP